jgi:hypothetical protein
VCYFDLCGDPFCNFLVLISVVIAKKKEGGCGSNEPPPFFPPEIEYSRG